MFKGNDTEREKTIRKMVILFTSWEKKRISDGSFFTQPKEYMLGKFL